MAELPDNVVTGLLCLLGMFGVYGAYLGVNTWLAGRLEWRRQRELGIDPARMPQRKVMPGERVWLRGSQPGESQTLTNRGNAPIYVDADRVEEVRRG